MQSLKKLALATVVCLAPLASTATSAHAVAPNFPTAAVMHINAEGFRICKAMGDRGHTAIIRGLLGDGGGSIRGGAVHSRFNIRTCFETRAECNHFLDRIHHRVSQIEQIYISRCRARG